MGMIKIKEVLTETPINNNKQMMKKSNFSLKFFVGWKRMHWMEKKEPIINVTMKKDFNLYPYCLLRRLNQTTNFNFVVWLICFNHTFLTLSNHFTDELIENKIFSLRRTINFIKVLKRLYLHPKTKPI